MIRFDPTLFRCDYVRLKKITSSYLYVSTTSEGKPYSTNTSVKGKYKNREISKVKIHENVARQYFKNNSMKEFQDLGKFACIAYYGDIVVAVEVQNLSQTVDKNKEWVAVIEKVMNNINSIIPPQEDVYINGKDIFWIEDVTRNKGDHLNISSDGAFKLQYVKYLSLSKIGVEIQADSTMGAVEEAKQDIRVIKTIGSKRDISSESIRNLQFNENFAVQGEANVQAVALLKESVLISYSPNRGQPNEIECFSPVLAFENHTEQKKNDDEFNKTLEHITGFSSNTDPIYLNLNFVLYAGKLIGEKYGFIETEILNTPEIIKDTKVVSLEKIYPSSRTSYPINLPVFDGLAWLFRFIYKEKDLNNMRDLSNLFNKIFKDGFIQQSKVMSAFREGKSQDDIYLLKYKPQYLQK